jgi:hypothetical protein
MSVTSDGREAPAVGATVPARPGASLARPGAHAPDVYVGKHLGYPHTVLRGDVRDAAALARICARWALDATPEWSDEVKRIATRLDELAGGGS